MSNPGTLDQHAEMLTAEAKAIRSDMAYLFECTDVVNERIAAQRSAFVWRGDPALPLLDGVNNVFAFRISSHAKPGIIKQLNILGVNSHTLRIS